MCRGEGTGAPLGIRAGSINPNLFQDQEYKFGSLCNPSAEIRKQAVDHVLDSIEIAKRLGVSRYLAVAARRLQLSRHAEHSQTDRLA
jgi:L-rhamnose isomerase